MRLSLDKVEQVVSLTARTLAVFGLALLMLFATSTLLDGVLRGTMNTTIEPVRDIGGLIVAIAVACCLPLGMWERQNITITIIDKLVSERAGQALSVFAALIVALITIAIAYQLQSYAGKLLRASERTIMLGVPSAPFWYIVAGLLWWTAVVQSLVALTEIARLFGRSKPATVGPDTNTF